MVNPDYDLFLGSEHSHFILELKPLSDYRALPWHGILKNFRSLWYRVKTEYSMALQWCSRHFFLSRSYVEFLLGDCQRSHGSSGCSLWSHRDSTALFVIPQRVNKVVGDLTRTSWDSVCFVHPLEFCRVLFHSTALLPNLLAILLTRSTNFRVCGVAVRASPKCDMGLNAH